VPLLVRPPHEAEVLAEQVVTLEAEELAGALAVAGPDDPGHGDLGVVVTDPAGHAAEEGEGPDVALEERLGALAGEGAGEDRVGVRQRHDEHRDGGRPAVEGDLGLPEVGLGLAGRVGQRDEHLGGATPPGADGVLDPGQPARVAVLGLETLVDPLGGVPLLLRRLLVVLEDLVDDREQGLEDGGPLELGPPVSGRLGVVEDPLEGLPVDLVLAAGGAPAEAVGEDATADLGPVFHVGIHPVASQTVPPVVGLSASIVATSR
jgi:hypothetical protein